MHFHTGRDLGQALQVPCSEQFKISGFAIDSRKVVPGTAFVALKGEQVDGHAFIAEAIKRGASCIISMEEVESSIPVIRVGDTVDALQQLARKAIAPHQKIIGITGSVGKTTTKDFTATLLSSRFRVGKSRSSMNSQRGLPLTLLNDTDGSEEILVLEMAMSEPGNISRLISFAPPTIALINSLHPCHAIYFSSYEQIAQAKAEIFSHPQTQLGLLPLEIDHFDLLCQTGTCRKKTFSLSSSYADYHAQDFTLPTAGNHNRHNFLAAASIALELGMTWDEILLAAQNLHLPEKRMTIEKKNGVTFVNDSYNAGPWSVKAALESLPSPESGGRVFAALGGMLELGEKSEAYHKEIGTIALDCVDRLFCIGEETKPFLEVWEKAGKKISHHSNNQELTLQLQSEMAPGDVVLLKGSNGYRMWEVLDHLKEEK